MQLYKRNRTRLALCAVTLLLLAVCRAEEADTEADKLFDLANGLYIRGNAFYGQAVRQYREFLSRYPNDERCDQATFFLGNCLRELGQNEEALKAYLDHRKFKNSPNRDMVDFRTGQVYFSLGKHPEAIQSLLKVHDKKVEQNLTDSVAFWLGWSYLKNNEPAKAIPVLTKLADGKEGPLVPWANFHLAYAHLAAEDLAKSIERFQKAAATLPQHRAECLFRMAEARAKLGKYQEAYAEYREIVEKHAESPFRGRAAFGAVWSLYTAKDYANAIVVYDLVGKLLPDESRAEAAYILANSYYETNKLTDALKMYRKVVSEFQGSPFAARAEYKACWCLFLQGSHDDVITAGKAFLKKYPSDAEVANVHFLVGESLYEKNRLSEALSEYQSIVGRFPTMPFRDKAMFKLGLCSLKTGQQEQARDTFRSFAATYPENELAPEALGRAAECGLTLARLADKPELQAAQYEQVARDYAALGEKYSKSPGAADALYQLGVTYARLGKHNEMIQAFQKLVKSYPKHDNCAEAYYWLGSESEKGGENDVAAQRFEQSVALKPNGPYAEQAKYRLAGLYFKKDAENERAAGLIVEILKGNPQSDIPEETHLGVADLLLRKAKYDAAIEVYGLFLKKYGSKTTPRLENAYYGLGDCYFKQGKWQQAIDNFSKAIEFKGDLISLAKLSAGVALLKLGRNKQAEEVLGEVAKSGVVELEAKAYYWLGNMRFAVAQSLEKQEDRVKQYNVARGEYMRVVILYTLSEVRPESMYRVAECLEREGLAEDAKQELQRLIREYPKNEFTKKAREKLGEVPASTTGG
ncbi:MAG: tetratricopeptide repeat protein [bacterium]|nr:tetratricopeptide repeat protein [bacterium]